jgi:hypothetical protein
VTSRPSSTCSIRPSLGSALAITLAASATAQAQLPSVVELGVRTCESAEAARVEELVRVEMRADGIEEVRAISETEVPALARIAVEPADCDAQPGAYRIAIDDVATHKRVERSVSLADVDEDARPRALALAIAELLRASWAELAYVEPPPAMPRRILETVRLRDPPSEDARELTIPEEVPVEEPARETPRVLFDTGALVRVFPGARSALLGGRLAASIAIVPRLRLEVGGEGGAGQSLDRLGRVDLWYAAGALGLGVDVEMHPLLFVASVRTALGYGGASGDAYDPSTLIGDGGAFIMFVSASLLGYLEIVPHVHAVFGIELGATAAYMDAIADGTAIAGIRGPMLAASLGVALSI